MYKNLVLNPNFVLISIVIWGYLESKSWKEWPQNTFLSGFPQDMDILEGL